MKALALGLQTSVVGSYDQTKTTLQGRVNQRTITDGNGAKSVLGPSPVVSGDVFDDTGAAPVGVSTSTANGRIFISKGFAAGVLTLSYYTFNLSTGITSWVGDLKFTFTNTGAYTIRGFKVDDSNPASMSFHFATTNTTVQQGGYYAVFGVPTTDFLPVSIITYPVATTASTNKVIYQIGDTASQAAHTITVADGLGTDTAGTQVYILNGAAATPKIFKITYSASPTTAPTAGYSQWNTGLVTGTLTALTGVVLLVNNVQVFTPTNQPSPNAGNNGSLSLFFMTTTTIYWAKVSDITAAVTSLPSLLSSNMAISSSQLTPTASMGGYSQFLDKWVIETSLGAILVKQGINNDPNGSLTSNGAIYIKNETGGTITPPDFTGVTNACMTDMNGWQVMVNTAVGQRGFVAWDASSDENVLNPSTSQIYSSIISPVISGTFTKGAVMGMFYELAKRSVRATVQFRTSGFATGPGVGFDATWTSVPKDGDLSTLVNASQVQFRFLFSMSGFEVTNPPQLNEAYVIYNDATQISENWEGSQDNSTNSGTSPMYVAFRMRAAYASVVPKLFVRGVDDSGNVIFLFDTVTNIGVFSYSTNNGTSWTPLGTIPNTPFTTEVRVNVASPSGTRLTWSIAES